MITKKEIKIIKTMWQNSCCGKKWVMTVVFILLATVWKTLCAINPEEMGVDISMFFLVAAGMMPMEIFILNGISGFVQSSPCQKINQTKLASFLLGGGLLILFVYEGIHCLILGSVLHGNPEVYLKQMLLFGILACLFGISATFLYKFFWGAMVVLYLVCFIGGFLAGFFMKHLESVGISQLPLSWPACVLVGMILVILGAFGNYAVSSLFFKRRFSKHAFGDIMKKMV